MLLDQKIILSHVKDSRLMIEVFDTLPSTQTYLKAHPTPSHLQVCLTENQSHGYGRLGRPWVGPKERNIYMSLCYDFIPPPRFLPSLSLAVGICVADVLASFQPHLKWPNDIYFQDKKAGGILVEVIDQTLHGCKVIIGLGLNVNMADLNLDVISSPWISLEHIAHQPLDRNILVAKLLAALIPGLENFEQHGLKTKSWDTYDYLAGKRISIQRGDTIYTGTACGITPDAHLCLRLEDGTVETFSSGDAQIMKASLGQ